MDQGERASVAATMVPMLKKVNWRVAGPLIAAAVVIGATGARATRTRVNRMKFAT